MKTIRINGANVAVHGELTGGRPVIMAVHGAGGGGWIWDGLRDALAGCADLLAIDLPGHGSSEGAGSQQIEEYGNVVRDVVKSLGTINPYAMGHSMGGAISMDWAISHPGELSGIIPVCTGARLRVHPMVFEALEGDMNSYLGLMEKTAFGPNTSAEILKMANDAFTLVDPKITAGDFRACNSFDVMEAVKDINLPTLVLCGSEDNMTPPKYSQYLADNIDGAIIAIIEGAGHMLPVESPGGCAEHIRRFIS